MLVIADFRREYAIHGAGLADLSRDEFLWLLQGLSRHSRFREALDAQPKTLHDPAERAELIAAALR